MKKAKLLSLFLSASLLLHTCGIDALAAAPSESVPISETVKTIDQNISGQASVENDEPGESADKKYQSGQPSNEYTGNHSSLEKEYNSEQPFEEDEEHKDLTGEPGNSERPSSEDEKVKESSGEADNPEKPSMEDGETKEPTRETDTPGQSSIEDGETKEPTGETGDPALPSIEGSAAKDPSEESDNPEQPSQNADGPEVSEDGTISSEDAIPESTISENALSESSLPDENTNTNIFSIFPGLGDHYQFSFQELTDKKILSSHTGDIVRINSRKAATIEDYTDIEGEYEPGEVVYLSETKEKAEQVANAFGGTLESYSYNVAVISLPEKATVALAVAAAAEPDIKLPAVWPNYYNYLDSDKNGTTTPLTPADPDFAEQWQHDYIGTRYAWAAGYKGQGINVAVIDTGLQQNHEDLSSNADDGKNFVRGANGTPYAVDNQTHGTHVAGIIAADDNEKGGIGIAPDARVRGYCVFPADEGARDSDIMSAINAAVEDGNDIINMSLGSAYYSEPYEKVVNDAYKKGVAIFAAVGNSDSTGQNYPAAYAGTISVGAVDQNGTRASFSNYNQTVALSFPGVAIYSTVPTGYDYMSGTSQASPAAAGTAAIILSANETIWKKTGKARVDALLSAMKSSTTKCSDSGMGAGTTYLPGVLKLATETTVPEAPIITVIDEFSETRYTRGKNQKDYIENEIKVTLSTNTAVGVDIYYATDGKTPTFKNGAITNADNSEPYVLGTEITLTGAKTKTIKAIAVNPFSGKASKAVSKSFTLTPIPTVVTVTPKDNVSRIVAGKSLKFTATVTPSYAISGKVSWSMDDKTKAAGITVSNGTVKTKAGSSGTYTVKATAVGSDGTTYNGVTGTYTFTVIESSDIKKVAFLDTATKKALKSKILDTVNKNNTFELKNYLTVTKASTELSGEAALEEVVWSSSNTKVATVSDDGTVTAIAPGKAIIKAISNNGGNKSASCTVTVSQPVTGIAIYGPTKMAVGRSISLAAEIQPANASNKKLDWKVSGNDKVTVSAAGKVTAKKDAAGKCTVTATAKDGSNISSAAYEITIVSGEITKITLDTNKLTLFPPNTTNTSDGMDSTKATLTPTVDCNGANSTLSRTLISWTSSAPSIASVDENGNITAKAAGKAIITCAATDGSNKKATCTVNISIPMSRLVIGPTDGNEGLIAVGKKVKMSAKYYSIYGTPNNTKVDWKIIGCSDQSLQDKVSVDQSGMVSVSEAVKATSTSNDYIVVQAVAQDGSGVESNLYRLAIKPNYLTARIEYMSGRGFIILATTEKTSPKKANWNTVNWEWVPDYCTATISAPKHCGLSKARGRLKADGPIYAAYSPIPVKKTNENLDIIDKLPVNKLDKMTLTIKLKDGSNLTAKQTIYAIYYINSNGDPDIGYFY